MRSLNFIFLAAIAGTACSGSVPSSGKEPNTDDDSSPDDDGRPPVEEPECRDIKPGTSPLRRLSNAEYRNTVSDLLGMGDMVKTATMGFDAETESLGFRNSAEFLKISTVGAQNFMAAADTFATAAAGNKNLVNCDSAEDKRACGADFIRDFGLRAYRRPLNDEEQGRFAAVFQKALETYDASAGIEAVVLAMLQSPHFLFRVEFGQDAQGKSYTKPTAYETASRLSYLLWQSMPDDALFEAAAKDELQSSAQILAQAKRMLDDPKAERSLEFFRQWFDSDGVKTFSRDEKFFGKLPDDLQTLFAQENDAFTKHLIWETDGTFEDLLTAPYTFVNNTLAKHYELDGNFDSSFTKVERAGSSGFLTQSGFLTAHDKPSRTSIVNRGVKIRTDLLCQIVPAPPEGVEINLDAGGVELSQKERLAKHREEPKCAGCHALVDPLGEIFETYDAVGRLRSKDETGGDIATIGEVTDSIDGEIDGVVSNANELGQKFAQSAQVKDCFVSQNFRFFYGRDHTEQDTCSRARLTKAFADSGYRLKDMLLALTQTDAFLYRPIANP